ncbi:MAG: glycosyltransferase family 25 protein, partial [Haemophilus parainfluenzae]|nr:glycosyltransferase family 25 protein [Haemophilus parainfluenzae]
MSCVKQHNYVISLTRETKRRKHIEQEFGRQNILFSFFDAVTPDRIEDVAKKFNIILDRSSEAKLWDGEIGCALSHISLWNLALEKSLDYINIFEDDVYLGENAKELLEVDYLPDDIDVLKLEAN